MILSLLSQELCNVFSLFYVFICFTACKEKEALKKLTHKERKKLKQQMEYEKQMELMLQKGGHGSSALDENFTVSQVEKSGKQQELLETAVDIKVCYIVIENLVLKS